MAAGPVQACVREVARRGQAQHSAPVPLAAAATPGCFATRRVAQAGKACCLHQRRNTGAGQPGVALRVGWCAPMAALRRLPRAGAIAFAPRLALNTHQPTAVANGTGAECFGVRFFRRFLCAFKEIGSGASRRVSEVINLDSRTKPATHASKYADSIHAKSKTSKFQQNRRTNTSHLSIPTGNQRPLLPGPQPFDLQLPPRRRTAIRLRLGIGQPHRPPRPRAAGSARKLAVVLRKPASDIGGNAGVQRAVGAFEHVDPPRGIEGPGLAVVRQGYRHPESWTGVPVRTPFRNGVQYT